MLETRIKRGKGTSDYIYFIEMFLSASCSKAHASRDHFFSFFLFRFFLSPDFNELWHSVMSTCLITEVKQQWAAIVLGWVTASEYGRQKPLSALFAKHFILY